MGYKFNPFTGSFDKVEQSSKKQQFDLAVPTGALNLARRVKDGKTLVYEGGALSIAPFTKTGPKQITFNPVMPAGTIFIIQLP